MDVPPMQKSTAPASWHMSRAPLNWTACVSTTTKLAKPGFDFGGTRKPCQDSQTENHEDCAEMSPDLEKDTNKIE